ncbi:transmembrane protein, putative [Medicago truncatula]|uniref:Transmembrane protein, putative n=1 Tax=Medicago truncatula TaxID=3880 RepID=G7KPP9_MEDTR|nr:transmembrane protein, putative [Medicago truncatula]
MEPPNKRTKIARTSVELGHKRNNPSKRNPLSDVTNGVPNNYRVFKISDLVRDDLINKKVIVEFDLNPLTSLYICIPPPSPLFFQISNPYHVDAISGGAMSGPGPSHHHLPDLRRRVFSPAGGGSVTPCYHVLATTPAAPCDVLSCVVLLGGSMVVMERCFHDAFGWWFSGGVHTGFSSASVDRKRRVAASKMGGWRLLVVVLWLVIVFQIHAFFVERKLLFIASLHPSISAAVHSCVDALAVDRNYKTAIVPSFVR